VSEPFAITDAVRRKVHESDDLELSYDETRAFHAILTKPDERRDHLEWLQRNDILFFHVMGMVSRELGDVPDDELYKAIAIVLAKYCRQLITKGGAA
jgi:hypothetical protein